LSTSWVPFNFDKSPFSDQAENIRLSDAFIRELTGTKTSDFKSIYIDNLGQEIDTKLLKLLFSENVSVLLLEDDDLYAKHGLKGEL